jgi:hypothetical protein
MLEIIPTSLTFPPSQVSSAARYITIILLILSHQLKYMPHHKLLTNRLQPDVTRTPVGMLGRQEEGRHAIYPIPSTPEHQELVFLPSQDDPKRSTPPIHHLSSQIRARQDHLAALDEGGEREYWISSTIWRRTTNILERRVVKKSN